jgi:hypothetical protein
VVGSHKLLHGHIFFRVSNGRCSLMMSLRLCPVVAACGAAYVPWPCIVVVCPAACGCGRAKLQISLHTALRALQTHALSLLICIPSRRACHNSLATHADWNPAGDRLMHPSSSIPLFKTCLYPTTEHMNLEFHFASCKKKFHLR